MSGRQQRRWVDRVICSLAIVAVPLLAATVSSFFTPVEQPAPRQSAGPSSVVTVAPAPPAEEAEETPPLWAQWQYVGATLTYLPAGIDHAGITPPQSDWLSPVLDGNGSQQLDSNGQPAWFINDAFPKDQFVWYAIQDPQGYWYPYGSALSNTSELPIVLYCHDYWDGSSVCSSLYDVLQVGDILTIESGNEVVQCLYSEGQIVDKGTLAGSSIVQGLSNDSCLIVTCWSQGPRNAEGTTTQYTVMAFKRLTPQTASTPDEAF